MAVFTTVLLPAKGRIGGNCITNPVSADNPEDAASKTFGRYPNETGRTCLVVQGDYTYAFRALKVRRVEVTEA